MEYKFYLAIVTALATLLSCQRASKKSVDVACNKIEVSEPIALPVEKLIADYDTIRLETSDQSLLSDILQIHLMNNKLYVTDSSLAYVIIFSKQGKYLSKICNQGEGPSEYIKIGSFETDKYNNRLLLTDSFSKRLFEYNENGELLRVIPLSFMPNRIASDQSGRFIHTCSASKLNNEEEKILNNCIHIVNEQGKITDTYLTDDTPQRLDIRSACAASYTAKGELLYMPILSNTIFKVQDSQAIPEYTILNRTKRKSVSDEKKKTLHYEYHKDNIGKAEQEGYLISCESFLSSDSLTFLDLGWDNRLYTYYSKADSTSITINPNDLQGNKGLCEIFSAHPKAIDGHSLYISVPMGKIAYTLPLLPDCKLKTFFESTKEGDNPVVIAYRVRDNLF